MKAEEDDERWKKLKMRLVTACDESCVSWLEIVRGPPRRKAAAVDFRK